MGEATAKSIMEPVAVTARPLRILMPSYRSDPFTGGQGVYMRLVTRALADMGHTVHVVSGPPYPHLDPRVKLIFRVWVVVFGLVGAQMSWVLRPFVGNPHQPFTFFRERDSHFFQAVIDAVRKLLSW